jgi:type I pantothenate kinase
MATTGPGFDEWSPAQWHRLLPVDAPLSDDVGIDRPLLESHAPLAELVVTRRAARLAERQALADRVGEFVGPVPYLVGVTGGVASGKSLTAATLSTLLHRRGLAVEVVTTDGFLFSNRVLDERGLTARKGFPESYDHARLLAFVVAVKSGAEVVEAPLYDHVTYDVVPDRTQHLAHPDVVVLEGLNVLELDPGRDATDRGVGEGERSDLQVSDLLDFAVYVDAAEQDLRSWFHHRLSGLRTAASADGGGTDSFYAAFAAMTDEQFAAMTDHVWDTINRPNLVDHVLPTRSRADLILEKAPDHTVRRIRLRRR